MRIYTNTRHQDRPGLALSLQLACSCKFSNSLHPFSIETQIVQRKHLCSQCDAFSLMNIRII